MDNDEIERFEAAAGDLLSELHFDRMFSRIRTSVQARVDALKREFAIEVEGRWSLPQPW